MSQSTCSWNTRLYLTELVMHCASCLNPRAHGTRVCTATKIIWRKSRLNPRAHGTRVCTTKFGDEIFTAVSIHVLMEHAFVPRIIDARNSAQVSIHVLMEHAFVRRRMPICWDSVSQSTCSWNTRLYSATSSTSASRGLNPRAHGTRVCTCAGQLCCCAGL